MMQCHKCGGPIGLKYVFETATSKHFHPECAGFTNLLDPEDYDARIKAATAIMKGR